MANTHTQHKQHARTHRRTRNTHARIHARARTHKHTQRTHIYQVLHHCIGNVGIVHPINCTNTRTRISLTVYSDDQQLLQQMNFSVSVNGLVAVRKRLFLLPPRVASFLVLTWFQITMSPDKHIVGCFRCVCVCVCPTDSNKDKVLCVSQYMYTYVYVSYCMLFYWSFMQS